MKPGKVFSWITVFLFLISVPGCGLKSGKKDDQPAVASVPQSPYSSEQVPDSYFGAMPASEGSLWTDSGEMLFVDERARRVGDTVIIDIVENTSSEMDVNTKTSKDTTIDMGIPNALGYMTALQAKNPNLNPSQLFVANVGNEFEGKGKSDRSGYITASIGARVTHVLPNGNVVVYGKREMRVNNEVQFITVSGMIRPKDIGADNRVKSTYLADAKIEYSGTGVLADKQKPGWGERVLDKVWPF